MIEYVKSKMLSSLYVNKKYKKGKINKKHVSSCSKLNTKVSFGKSFLDVTCTTYFLEYSYSPDNQTFLGSFLSTTFVVNV